ncbi:MAG: cellulase family glycosylhydrolase [Bacteroidota bacterium]|nr:glycosyl hydrolase family 5 [Odoribacter sp.]MDP3643645.1 cellulase family glycosylhydrolase [Bacteroidota bacterium]
MKNLLLLAFAIVLISSCKPKPVSNGSPADFKIFKGTNIAHWLSQSDARGSKRDSFFQEKDVLMIKSLGFDHLRLPIDEEQMWDENGVRHEDAFKLMTNCLDWCRKHQLKVIVDLHILRSHHFNAETKPLWTDPLEQEKFYRLWIDLSSVLKDYPLSDVAYELMNEAVADDPEQWNNLLANAMKAIRVVEPERIIVVGSNKWQSASTFDVLKVPVDKNIILSFHFYEPFPLTHHQASWTGIRDYSGPIHYPGVLLTQEEFDVLSPDQQAIAKDWVGVEWSVEKLEQMMQLPLQKSKELGLQVYCGEYGVIDSAPEADKIRWYNDMISVFNKNGIASANWNYKSGSFGLLNGDGVKYEAMIQEVIRK